MDEIDQQIEFPIKDLLSAVIDELGVEERVSLKGEDRYITGNPDLLFRSFSNIVENALQYTTADEAIEIEIKPTYILFKDNGIGVSQSQWQAIFEPFYRVDESRTRNQSGAGLGLSIVKSIIEKHNGSITLVDCDDFKTCFRVDL